MTETASASSCALSFRFPLIAFSLLPINADWCPFASSFHWYSCFNSFVSGLKISGSDLLIHASLPWSSISGRSDANCVVQSLVRKMPIRFCVDQTDVSASYTNVPEYRLRVPVETTIKLRLIWYQILERCRHVVQDRIDQSNPAQPHECLLPRNTHRS